MSKKQLYYKSAYVRLYALTIALAACLIGKTRIISGHTFAQNLSISFYYDFKPDKWGWVCYYRLANSLGGIFGSLLGAYFTMMIFLLLFTILLVLKYLPINSPFYHTVVKLVLGFCAGYLSFLCPLFIFEIAPFQERGRLMGLVQFMITLGVLYTQGIQHLTLVAFDVSEETEQVMTFTEKLWKQIPLFIGPILLALCLLAIFKWKLKQETPQYYLNEENSVKIIDALSYLLNQESVQKANLILIEQDKYLTFIQKHSSQCAKCKLFGIASSILILQIACGFNAILLLVYQIAPFDLEITYYFYVLAAVNCASFLFYLIYLYRVSHKVLLVGGLFLLSSCESSAFIFSYYKDHDEAIGFIFGLSCFFVLVYELSIGPIALIQVHQILLPSQAALATSLNWVCNFIVTLGILLARTEGTQNTINLMSVFFIGSCFIGALIIIVYYPEVQRRYKSEIQTEVSDMVGIRDTGFSMNEEINSSSVVKD